jgi:hypothetical protein
MSTFAALVIYQSRVYFVKHSQTLPGIGFEMMSCDADVDQKRQSFLSHTFCRLGLSSWLDSMFVGSTWIKL